MKLTKAAANAVTRQKQFMYFLLALLVIFWGLEFVFAKQVLQTFEPLTLVFFKYLISAAVLAAVRWRREGRKKLLDRRDLPALIACAFFGEIGYFFCEYTAMDYLPISLITIILASVPVLSLISERLVYKRPITRGMLVGVMISVVGVGLVIGADIKVLMSGRLAGYLLAFGAAISWNIYNFVTESLQAKYTGLSLSLGQQLCSAVLVLPYAVAHLPEASQITVPIVAQLLYLAVVSGAFGFVVYVKALRVVGITPTAMSSNFIPLTSTFFGWWILREMITPMQIFGGAVVIASACLVIYSREAALRAKGDASSAPSNVQGGSDE